MNCLSWLISRVEAHVAVLHRSSLQRHIARDCEGVELDSVEQAGSYAIAAAPQMFKDLIPGEKRECAFAVRDELQGWRLNIDLTLRLEARDPATDALDTGVLGELPGPSS